MNSQMGKWHAYMSLQPWFKMGGWESDDLITSSTFIVVGILYLPMSSASMIEEFCFQRSFKNFYFISFYHFPKANEKKVDQPPEAKKPKIKVVNVELPVEANLVWQLGRDLLNMYIETEVRTSNTHFGMCVVSCLALLPIFLIDKWL